MEHTCDYCDEGHPVTWAYETVARGWKFLCQSCYDWTPGIQPWAEPFVSTRYYPTFNYDTRVVS